MATTDRNTRPGAYEVPSIHLALHFAHPPKNGPAHIKLCREARTRWIQRMRQAVKDSCRGLMG